MRSKIHLVFCIMVLLVMFGTDQVFADGDGPDRPLTPAEKAYFSKILTTIDTALPKPPANWATIEKPSTSPPNVVPENSGKGSFKARYKGQWFDQSQKQRQTQKIQEYSMKSPPKERDIDTMQKQMDSLLAEQQKVMEELVNASRKNDKAALQSAQVKLQALQKKNQQATGAMFAPQEQALKEYPISDACLQVEVTVNHTSVGLKKAVPLNLPSLPKAFMVDDGNPGNRDCPYGKAVVLLGAWDNGRAGGEYTYFRSNWREGIPHPSAKNMIIEIRASEQRAVAYLKSVKWDALNGLLVK
ncbi:MAG: hypothetical protein QG578_1704 [Thermodesulfobacteriota bacterium]|nr:hypothetical protein [Thermodesulfobacteriota bacterium]